MAIEYLKYFFIPSCVFLNKNISYASAGIFSTINGLIKGNGKCEASNAYIRRFMRDNPSDTYIQKCLSSLEDEGYIKRISTKQKFINKDGEERFETKRFIEICADYEDKHVDLIPQLGSYEKKIIDNNELDTPSKPIVKKGIKPIVKTNSNTNIIVSKDTKGNSSPVKLKNLFLLENWRTKDTTPKSQHHLKEGTKVQKKINYQTTLLLNGKFSAVGDFDPKFISGNKLTPNKINHKYSKNELLGGLDELAKMFKMNNSPEDKTAINKMTFDQLIYHPIVKMSYLLKYLWNNVQPLTYKTVEVYSHWLEKLYEERIFDRSIENDNHRFGILKKGLVGIEEYYKWIEDNWYKYGTKYHLIGTEDKFFNTYVSWLGDRNVVKNNPYTIGPQGNTWYTFIKWLEEAIHGDYVHQYPTLDKRQSDGK